MNPTHYTPSVLATLRAMMPPRDASFREAMRVAELQATKLAQLFVKEDGIQECDIAAMPRIRVVHEDLDVSGMSHWNGQQWVISIARSDSLTRQRFTLMHEFKHIVDHGSVARLYQGDRTSSPAQQAEKAADYFAGCALVPRRELKSAWARGTQREQDLAILFGVSTHAIQVRLAQTGLNAGAIRPATTRCARPTHTPPGRDQRFRATTSTDEIYGSYA